MKKIGEISAIIALLSLGRLAITIPNLEPIGAAALFGGAMLGSWRLKFLIPFAALFIGDLVMAAFLPGYAEHLFSVSFLTVYIAFGATVLIGSQIVGKNAKMQNVVFGAVLSSVVFFLVSNFGTWAGISPYPKTMAGLMECYVAGLAFFKQDLFGNFFLNSIFGNVFFSVITFGAFQYYANRSAREVIAS